MAKTDTIDTTGLISRSYAGPLISFLLGDLQLFLLIFPFGPLFDVMPEISGLAPAIEAFNLVFIGLSVLYLVLAEKFTPDLRFSFPLMLFLVLLVTSILWVYPAMKGTSVHYTLRTLFTVLQGYIVVKLLTEEERLFDSLKILAIIITLISFAFMIIFPGRAAMVFDESGRAQSIFSTPNNLGQFLGFAFLAINYHKRQQLHLVLLLILDVIILYQLFKADSVTSMIGIAVIVIAFQFKRFLRPLFIFIVVAGLVIPHLNKIMPGNSSDSVGFANRDLTFTGRTEVWDMMMSDLAKNDRVLQGFGSGGYWLTDGFNPTASFNQLDWEPGQGHNGYMDIIVMTGVAGLLLFLVFLFHFISAVFRRISYEEQIVYFLTLIILINNITEASFFRQKHFYFVLLMVLYWYVYLKNSTAGIEEEET